jgi:chemotaxis protein MotA
MDFATFLGIISAFGLILISILSNSSLNVFVNIPSIFIVVGGTIGATLVNYTVSELINLFSSLKKAFFHKNEEYFITVGMLVKMSIKARREGILSLEADINEIEDEFLKNGLQMAVDGANEDTIREILSNEVYFMRERHKFGYEILNSMGIYSPAMGLIGTLIGLVQMLQKLNNPKEIGPSMAVALITTFYGAILANLIFIPLAGKLKRKSEKELLFKEACIDGIVSLAKGENPRILESRLLSFFTQTEKEEYIGSE